MGHIAIRVEGLSKQYRIGGKPRGYKTLRDTLADALVSPFRRAGQLWHGQGMGAAQPNEMIWALKDVSCQIKHGEIVGIIGANGAGKSTLLKILSRITEPTSGFAAVNGRLGSLLEVGTGFHPELTGRENTYLNGAILGMKRAEIEQKFDEIVAFAEVERFVDTPVKHYSTGMYLRLAFAVAAHLEPEILVVDEVLAVGDAAFQQKCLGKMGDVAREGRTVLFISHNMAAIKSLCSRAILLKAGHVARDGSVDDVVETYLTEGTRGLQNGIIPDDAPRMGTGEARIRSLQLTDLSGREVSTTYLGQAFRVELSLQAQHDIEDSVVEVSIAALDGTHIVHANTAEAGGPPLHFAKGFHSLAVEMKIVLLPRRYSLVVGIHRIDGTTLDFVERALDFTVLNVAVNGGDHYPWSPVRGYVRPLTSWRIPDQVSIVQ
jgi:lipopolysaccharide transport system ATP-binding protein